MRPLRTAVPVLLAGLAMGSCDDPVEYDRPPNAGVGEGSSGPADTGAVLGPYRVESWQAAAKDCEKTGDVIEQRSTHVLVREQRTLAGLLPPVTDDELASILVMVRCDGIIDCQLKSEDANTLHVGAWPFDSGDADHGWEGLSWGMAGLGDRCHIGVTEYTLAEQDDFIDVEAWSIRFELAGGCPDRYGLTEAREALEQQPCSSREIVRASWAN